MIRKTVDDIRITAGGQVIEVDGSEVQLMADQDKIGTVLTNLLGNAVKYARDKPITVSWNTTPAEVKVSVRDQGPGIKANDLDRLFERYYRVENDSTQHISGFGIGLYLSAEIIKRHEGRIGAESEPGIGSTFWFTLPLTAFKL